MRHKVLWLGFSTDLWNRIPSLIGRGWGIKVVAGETEINRLTSVYGGPLPVPFIRIPLVHQGIGAIFDNLLIAKLILRERPELVVTDTAHVLSTFLVSLCQVRRLKVVWMVLSPPVNKKSIGVHNTVFRIQLFVAGVLHYECTALTPIVADLVAKMSRGKVRPVVTPAGIDGSLFNPMIVPVSRKELGIGEKDFVLSYHGEISKARRLDFLLELVYLLRASGREDFRLLIVGDGDDALRLRSIVKEMKISDFVLFVGRVPFLDVSRYIQIGDLEVAPLPEDRNWSTPYKVLEAMACGKPVITSIVDATKEIESKAHCLILKANNATEWAETLMRLMSKRASLSARGAAGNVYVSNNCSWEDSVNMLEAVFEKTISKG